MRLKTIWLAAAALTAVAISLSLAPRLLAEKANMSAAGLKKTATHVVTGKVVAIYTRGATDGDWEYTHYVAEVDVGEAEKGEGIDVDVPLYARYWTRRFTGSEMPPSTTGHRGLPKQDETLRIYLARNAYDGFTKDNGDGGFNVIGANGFERLESE